jgi:hypothetical protein
MGCFAASLHLAKGRGSDARGFREVSAAPIRESKVPTSNGGFETARNVADPPARARTVRLKYRLGRETLFFISQLKNGLSIGIPGEPRLRNVHLTVDFGDVKGPPKFHFTVGGGPSATHIPVPPFPIAKWGAKMEVHLKERVRKYDPSTIVYIPKTRLKGKIVSLYSGKLEGRESIINLRKLLNSALLFDLRNRRRWEPVRLDQVTARGLQVGSIVDHGRLYFLSPAGAGEAGKFTPLQWRQFVEDLWGDLLGNPCLLALGDHCRQLRLRRSVTADDVRQWIESGEAERAF